MTDEREELISKLKELIKTNSVKQKEYQEKWGYGPDVGCFTKEAGEIALLFPQMQRLNINLNELK